jgi:hypothetical protein
MRFVSISIFPFVFKQYTVIQQDFPPGKENFCGRFLYFQLVKKRFGCILTGLAEELPEAKQTNQGV